MSIIPYIIYLFVADSLSFFDIYKTAYVVLTSAHYYFIIISCVGVSVLIDLFYISMLREFKTPLYILFNSVSKNQKLHYREKKKIFNNLVNALKEGKIDL